MKLSKNDKQLTKCQILIMIMDAKDDFGIFYYSNNYFKYSNSFPIEIIDVVEFIFILTLPSDGLVENFNQPFNRFIMHIICLKKDSIRVLSSKNNWECKRYLNLESF